MLELFYKIIIVFRWRLVEENCKQTYNFIFNDNWLDVKRELNNNIYVLTFQFANDWPMNLE